MPAGIPVGTLAIGKAGAINAALLAASILASSGKYPAIGNALETYRIKETSKVAEFPSGVNHFNTSDQVTSDNITEVSRQIPVESDTNLFPKAPNSSNLLLGGTVGVLGGGQLARMLAESTSRLGMKLHVYTNEKNSPAIQVSTRHTIGSFTDTESLKCFGRSVDVVTCEFEDVPFEALETVSRIVPVWPTPKIHRICQDRLEEKRFVQSLGIRTAPFEEVDRVEGLKSVFRGRDSKIGFPAILKTTRFGYDGKGQVELRNEGELDMAWRELHLQMQSRKSAIIVESLLPLEKELSLIISRTADGQKVQFPLSENIHENRVLRYSLVPARIPPEITLAAKEIADKIADTLELVGLLAIEFFLVKPGTIVKEGTEDIGQRLLVNELAARPHNSGHWTIDASECSQFDQLVRCLLNLPLGSTEFHPGISHVEMRNLLGEEILQWKKLLKDKNTYIHLYDKQKVRPGRKMGHVTRIFYQKSEANMQ